MEEECLIIFTRYPEPGKTKTRMIPALGEVGAANLQRQMAEYLLRKVQELQRQFPIKVEVHFAGGSQSLMQAWLGDDLIYRQQRTGDLGQRMLAAFQQAFVSGRGRVAIIGTDCPEVDSEVLRQAFTALQQSQVVLGPAADGGYYLIGLNCLVPELFRDIAWGSSQVLAQTQEIIRLLKLKVSYLPLFHDVDYPEDLEFWEKCQV